MRTFVVTYLVTERIEARDHQDAANKMAAIVRQRMIEPQPIMVREEDDNNSRLVVSAYPAVHWGEPREPKV